MDPDAEFTAMSLPGFSPLRGLPIPPLAHRWPGQILRAAPIVRNGENFQIHPCGKEAPDRAWHWIVPVRAALDEPIDTSAILTSFIGSPLFVEAHDLINRSHVITECLFGEIIDLVAVSRDLSRIIGCMHGNSPILGRQEYPDHRSIRVFRTVNRWMRANCFGVVMLGSDYDTKQFLDNFKSVVTDDVKHGESLLRAMKRVYAGPEIMVAA